MDESFGMKIRRNVPSGSRRAHAPRVASTRASAIRSGRLIVTFSGFRLKIGTNDPDELAIQASSFRDRVVNALCQACQVILVAGTGDDTRVRLLGVQDFVVAMIVR